MPLSSEPSTQTAQSFRMVRWERGSIALLFLLILVLKACYVGALSINSDEPQHLHVAWGWTQGMVQYRDFFDNHTPLFHLAMAPLLAWIGERADILLRMRLAMLPLFAVSLGCIYWLGARLYSQRAGIWAVLLAATTPVFLIKSSEFRADALWMTVWFAALAVGLSGRFTRLRAFAAGLLLGVTIGISMKTALLLVSLLGSLGLIFLLLPKQECKTLLRSIVGNALPALAGLCIVPLAIVGFFAAKGALGDLSYCVFEHNAVPGNYPGLLQMLWQLALFLLLLVPVGFFGRAILQMEPQRPLAVRQTLVFFTATVYLLLLNLFWPDVTAQDYLPVTPLLALCIAPWLLRLNKNSAVLLLLATGVQMTLAIQMKSPFSRTRALRDQALVAHVLQLTKPSDYVMDSKGETIFRHRPFRFVLETFTLRRMDLGLLSDTIAADMVKTRTCVVLLKRLPEKSSQWVAQYYIPVTQQLFVTGCFLPPPQKESGPRSFEVAIAANYIVASTEGTVRGKMDGVDCTGPVFLNPGHHTFACADSRPLAVFWAQAASSGFTPFQSAQHPD